MNEYESSYWLMDPGDVRRGLLTKVIAPLQLFPPFVILRCHWSFFVQRVFIFLDVTEHFSFVILLNVLQEKVVVFKNSALQYCNFVFLQSAVWTIAPSPGRFDLVGKTNNHLIRSDLRKIFSVKTSCSYNSGIWYCASEHWKYHDKLGPVYWTSDGAKWGEQDEYLFILLRVNSIFYLLVVHSWHLLSYLVR